MVNIGQVKGTGSRQLPAIKIRLILLRIRLKNSLPLTHPFGFIHGERKETYLLYITPKANISSWIFENVTAK